jgi:ketosteroid isomerase-like protein
LGVKVPLAVLGRRYFPFKKNLEMRPKQFIKLSLLFCVFLSIGSTTNAQSKKVAATSQSLYQEIAKMDSILFAAYNHQDFITLKSLFTNDLEWFQDNEGLITYQTVMSNFEAMLKRENKLTRTLIKGSLEVHPIKNYGAMETGIHEFRHFENGKEEIGNFKFLMIWKKTGDQWKISRVVSYDH